MGVASAVSAVSHSVLFPAIFAVFQQVVLSVPLSFSFQKENIGDLLIVNAQLSQAGMYTCTAQTVVDSALAAAKLVVRGKTYQN